MLLDFLAVLLLASLRE